MTYKKQLLHPKWKRKRGRILKRDGYKCTNCESKHRLHVHHTHYFKGAKAWEYNDCWLVTLCADCHLKEHETEIIPVEQTPEYESLDGAVTYKKFKKYLSLRLDQPFDVIDTKVAEWLGITWFIAEGYIERAIEEGFLEKRDIPDHSRHFYSYYTNSKPVKKIVKIEEVSNELTEFDKFVARLREVEQPFELDLSHLLRLDATLENFTEFRKRLLKENIVQKIPRKRLYTFVTQPPPISLSL